MLYFLTLILSLSFHAIAEGIYEPNVLWAKSDIKVCFADAEWVKEKSLKELDEMDLAYALIYFKEENLLKDWSEEEKIRIKNIITSEFTTEKTILTFSKFEDCRKSNDNDVILVRGTQTQDIYYTALSSLGQNSLFKLDFKSFQFPLPSSYEKSLIDRKSLVLLTLDDAKNLESTILHEFGHLAGLRHEHIHSEAINDKNCARNGLKWLKDERAAVTSRFYTEYDPSSIMNYCWLDYISNVNREIKTELSKNDLKTIQGMYYFLLKN
jgi:hypothetical protein